MSDCISEFYQCIKRSMKRFRNSKDVKRIQAGHMTAVYRCVNQNNSNGDK